MSQGTQLLDELALRMGCMLSDLREMPPAALWECLGELVNTGRYPLEQITEAVSYLLRRKVRFSTPGEAAWMIEGLRQGLR